MYIANNVYENKDNWWPFSGDVEGNFYIVDKQVSRPKVKEMDPEKLYITGIF